MKHLSNYSNLGPLDVSVHMWTDKWMAPISSSLVQIIHTYVHAYIHQTHMPPPIKACDPFPHFSQHCRYCFHWTLPANSLLFISLIHAFLFFLLLLHRYGFFLFLPPPPLCLLPPPSLSSSAASLSSFLFLLLPSLVPPLPLSLMSFSSSLKHSTPVLTSMYWSYHMTKMGSVPKTTILDSNNKLNTSKHILAKCIVVLLKMP